MSDEPHAVRWATRKNKFQDGGLDWGKWHWTEDSNITVCGHMILIANPQGSFMPDTDDMVERVDCKDCLRKLEEK